MTRWYIVPEKLGDIKCSAEDVEDIMEKSYKMGFVSR